MDLSVALVQAYLRVNGYFTVAEFPVVERSLNRARHAVLRTATDMDILAFRFPRAEHRVPAAGRSSKGDQQLTFIDPALGMAPTEADMLIGEVKEGRAELNSNATDPAVLRAVLVRFGCCDPAMAEASATELAQRGRIRLPNGHAVRLVAFGSVTPPAGGGDAVAHTVSLGHIHGFLSDHIRTHWQVLKSGGTKDPALSWLFLEEKMRRAARTGGPPRPARRRPR